MKWKLLLLLFSVFSFDATAQTACPEETAGLSVVKFDLNACTSFFDDDSHTVYSEFTAKNDNNSDCADMLLIGRSLYRNNPITNHHSCTPGHDGNEGMCVSSSRSCDYESDSDQAIRFDIEVTPSQGKAQLKELKFYEKGPATFEWIDGESGPNDYPTTYGVRITVAGTEIYRRTDIPTNREWTLQTIDLSQVDGFEVDVPTIFSFELLGYCPTGNGAEQSIWDVDDIAVYAGCVTEINGGMLSGDNGGSNIDLCVGDAISYGLAPVLEFASGSNQSYILTDTDGVILDLPAGQPLELKDFGPGSCSLYNVSYDGDLSGLSIGSSLDDLDGCYDLSNALVINKIAVEGDELDFDIALDNCDHNDEVRIVVSTRPGDLPDGVDAQNNTWEVLLGRDIITGSGNPFSFAITDETEVSVTLNNVSSNGCDLIFEKTVNPQVMPAPAPRFTFEVSDCNETEVSATFRSELDNINNMPVASYEWVFFMNNNSFNMSGRNVDVNIPTRFDLMVRLILTLDNGCSYTVTEPVDFGDVPSLKTFSNPIYVCNGDTPNLVSNPNNDWFYNWVPETGLTFSNSSKANPVFDSARSQSYSVTIVSALCSVEEEVEVIVLEDIIIDVTGDLTNCSPRGTLSINDPVNITYEWATDENFNNSLGRGASIDYDLSGQSVTDIYVRATAPNGCTSKTQKVSLNITDGLDIIFTDGGDGIIEVCEGVGGMIIMNPNPDWTYMWSPMTGLTGDLSNPKVNPTTTTTYTVTVTSGDCEVTSEIQVVPGDNIDIEIRGLDVDGNLNTCAGSANLLAMGMCDPSYEWSRDPDFNTIISTYASMNITESGTYYVRGILENCTSEVEQFDVTLGDGPSIEFTDDGDGVVQVCQGVGGMIVKNPNPAWTYSWSPTTGLSGDLSSPKVNPTETTTYNVTVTDGQCEAYGEVQVVPSDQLDISVDGVDQNGSVNTCGRGVILTAVGNCDPNYEWSTDSGFTNILGTEPRLSITVSGTYFVRAVLDADCMSEIEMIEVSLGDGPFIEFKDGGDGVVNVCAQGGGTIVLDPNPSWTYTWSPIDGISGDLSNPVVNPEVATLYSVTVSDGDCEITETIEVSPSDMLEIEVLELDMNNNLESCSSTVDVTATGNSDDTYEWATDVNFANVIGTGSEQTITQSDTYFVRATFGSSCMSEVVEFTVSLGVSEVSLDFTGENGSVDVCEDIGGMIIVNPNSEWTYTWSPMDGISGDLSNPVVNPRVTTVYTVTVSDGDCEITKMIQVNPSDRLDIEVLDLDVDNNLDACSSSVDVTVTGNSEGTYEWATDADFVNVIGTGSVQTITESNTYFVRATMSTSCISEVVEFTVRLGEGSEVSLEFTDDDGSIEVCEGIGGMIIANPNPEWTYTWSPMDGLSGDLSSPKVNPAETTVYSVTVTDGECEVSSMIEVVPGDMLTISVSGVDGEGNLDVCGGSQTVTAVGNCEPNYEWSRTPDFADILSSNEFYNITEAGRYYVRAITGTDDCTSNVFEINAILGDGPSIVFTDNDDNGIVEVCTGIGGMIISNPNPEWTYTWSPMAGLSGDLSNPKVNPTETTIYTVTVTDGECETIGQVEVVPGNTMEIFVSGVDRDGNLDVCSGSQTVTATGNCEPNYEWSRTPDFDVIISTNDFYNITEEGIYYVRAITGDESCISEVEIINATLGDGPSVEFTDSGDGVAEICESSGGMIISNPNPEWTYTWSPMEGLSGDLSNPKVNPTEPTTYSVTVSDGVCETTGMVEVVPGDNLEIAVQGADSEGRVLVCNGETVTLTVTGNCEDSYEWSINENFDPVISTTSELSTQVTLGDEYYVRAVIDGCTSEVEKVTLSDISGEFKIPDGTELCLGDTITFTLEAVNNPDDINIVWEEDQHIISDLNSNEVTVISLEGDGDITLSFSKTTSDGTCTAMDSITIPMGMMMENLDVVTDIDCGSISVCFTTDRMDGDLIWDFGDDTNADDTSTDANPCYFYPGPGEYVVTVKGNTSCGVGEMFIPVLISDAVSISTMSDTISYCEGEELALSANSDIPQNIYWSLGGADTIGTGPSIMYTPIADTTIYAIVTDGATCRDSVSIFLDGYFFEVEVMAPEAICPGEPLGIEAVNSGTDSLTYLWGPEECIASGGDTPTPEINTELAKDLFLTVTNPENGCTKEFTVPIILSDLELELTADPDTIINRGESVDITAGALGDSLQWSWSNGETTETIVVQPEETTTYNVQVTDGSGCEADGTIVITVVQPVCDSSDVYIPTGFSPNGDGVNDEMIVRSNFIKDMQLDIYDRWGERVFETADQRTGWNGQFENTGEEMHPDTYAYCLKVTCTNDLSYTMLGNITLVR